MYSEKNLIQNEGSSKVMENKVEIFSNEAFGNLRTIEEDGKILFVASDVAKMLGYSRPADAVSSHCKVYCKTQYTSPTRQRYIRGKHYS